MSLYKQLKQLTDAQEIGIARVDGQRGGGIVVASTEAGNTVLLKGAMETGKKCYYDRRSNKIISEAPDISFLDLPV